MADCHIRFADLLYRTAYAPIGSPDSGHIASETTAPDAEYTLPTAIAQALQHNTSLMQHPVVKAIAQKYGKARGCLAMQDAWKGMHTFFFFGKDCTPKYNAWERIVRDVCTGSKANIFAKIIFK